MGSSVLTLHCPGEKEDSPAFLKTNFLCPRDVKQKVINFFLSRTHSETDVLNASVILGAKTWFGNVSNF